MDEKLKNENMQKEQFSNAGGVEWSDTRDDWLVKLMIMIIVIIYSDILQNAPFRSQIFKIFFASGDKGALTP